jgi:hypothetical protein
MAATPFTTICVLGLSIYLIPWSTTFLMSCVGLTAAVRLSPFCLPRKGSSSSNPWCNLSVHPESCMILLLWEEECKPIGAQMKRNILLCFMLLRKIMVECYQGDCTFVKNKWTWEEVHYCIVQHCSWIEKVEMLSWWGFDLPRKSAGVRKSDEVPKHKSQIHESQELRKGDKEDKESPKACTRLKSRESFYTCPRAPFYRETKRLLHSKNTLKTKEYSQCEHVHERLLHPVICGADFIHLQPCH